MPILDGFQTCKAIKQIYNPKTNLFHVTCQSGNVKKERVPPHWKKSQSSEPRDWSQIIKRELRSECYSPKSSKSFEFSSKPSLYTERDMSSRAPLIVAFSAFVDDRVRERAKEAGFDLVIESPLTSQKYYDLISVELAKRSGSSPHLRVEEPKILLPMVPVKEEEKHEEEKEDREEQLFKNNASISEIREDFLGILH